MRNLYALNFIFHVNVITGCRRQQLVDIFLLTTLFSLSNVTVYVSHVYKTFQINPITVLDTPIHHLYYLHLLLSPAILRSSTRSFRVLWIPFPCNTCSRDAICIARISPMPYITAITSDHTNNFFQKQPHGNHSWITEHKRASSKLCR